MVPNSGLKLRGLPPSTVHGREMSRDAQDRTWEAFHRTVVDTYDLKVPMQNQTTPTDSLSRPYPYYPASKDSNASCGAQLLVPLPSHITTDNRTTGHEQQAHLGLHRSTSRNKQNSHHPGPFDERWVKKPEEMWNTDATRTSPLTISPGESGNDSGGEYASNESCSGRSSFVKAVRHPSSTIAHANPSESLESWLDAVGPIAESRTSLELKHTPAHRFPERRGMNGDKFSTTHIEQHQAKNHSEEVAHDTSSGVFYPINERFEHGRAYTTHSGLDSAYIEGNPENLASILQQASGDVVEELIDKSLNRSKRSDGVPVPYHPIRQSSADSFSVSDLFKEILKGQMINAAIALEEFAHKYQLFDQIGTGYGSRGDTIWMSLLIEKAKQRGAMSEARKAKEETMFDRNDNGGSYASVLGHDLPSVVVTPNIGSPKIHGELILFEGTAATAHSTTVFETSSAERTMSQSTYNFEENQSQLDSYPEIKSTTEHTGAFSSHLSATMNLANMGEQEERVKTLRILQTQLSANITIQDTYGRQPRSQRLRDASGEQLYYEMTDLNDKPYILPWPPEEGSPAYKARHKPEQLLHLEAHPKGFFVSHPIECSEEIVRAHYLWIATGQSNINTHGNPSQAYTQFGNTRSENQHRRAVKGENRERFASSQNEMQQLDSVPQKFHHFVTGRPRNRSPGITQIIRQEIEPLRIKDTGDDSLDTSDATNYEQQVVLSFVPSTTGALVVLEDGVPSTEIPDLSQMRSTSTSQSAGCVSDSASTLACPLALASLNSNGPGYIGSTPGSYRSNHRPAMLHYRPGVDTMFPVPMARPSSRYQRLTSCGQPNYEVATKDEFQPFVEAARLRKPAFWGVMKFTGVSMLLSYIAKFISLSRQSDFFQAH